MTFSTIAQAISGVLAVSALAACSPVSPSISKFGPEVSTQPQSNATTFAQMTVIPATVVTTEAEFIREEAKLPEGVKLDAITGQQFDEFTVQGSTEVEIPVAVGAKAVELYAIIELAVNPHVADRPKMKKVELQFVKKDLNRFLISISREAGDESSRKYVRGLLSRISVGHRVVN